MRDTGRIFLGLVIFLALITFPVWYNLVSGGETDAPELTLPAGETQCVAETDYMRTEHMQLLMDWRDEVVRDNDRIYTAHDGRVYYKSLTDTCLGCHEQKDQFCDKCHNYVSVAPYCWDCHVVPEGGQ